MLQKRDITPLLPLSSRYESVLITVSRTTIYSEECPLVRFSAEQVVRKQERSTKAVWRVLRYVKYASLFKMLKICAAKPSKQNVVYIVPTQRVLSRQALVWALLCPEQTP